MRRFVAPAAMIAASIVGTVAVDIAPAAARTRDFTGSSTAHFGISGGSHCPNSGISGSLLRTGRRAWAFEATVCTLPTVSGASFSGPATITAPHHVVLLADITGSIASLSGVADAGFNLAITGGAGKFGRATGSVTASGTLDWATGDFAGTMAGSVATPNKVAPLQPGNRCGVRAWCAVRFVYATSGTPGKGIWFTNGWTRARSADPRALTASLECSAEPGRRGRHAARAGPEISTIRDPCKRTERET